MADKVAKEKASIYEKQEEGMEGWTQEQLEEAINSKHGTPRGAQPRMEDRATGRSLSGGGGGVTERYDGAG